MPPIHAPVVPTSSQLLATRSFECLNPLIVQFEEAPRSEFDISSALRQQGWIPSKVDNFSA